MRRPIDRLNRANGPPPASTVSAGGSSGLPEWMMSPIAMVCIVLMVLLIAQRLFHEIQSRWNYVAPNPACYTITGTPERTIWSPTEESLLHYHATRNAAFTAGNCPADSCAGRDLQDFKDALDRYASARIRLSTYAYREEGKSAVAWVDNFYNTNQDYAIRLQASSLVKSGKLKLSQNSETERFMRLLIKTGSGRVPFCYAPN